MVVDHSCNQLRTDPYIEETEPIMTWSFSVNRPKKDWLRPVFCQKICHINITYVFHNNYYLDHLIVLWKNGGCNSPAFGPTFRRFHEDLTKLWPKQKYIA